MYYASSDSVNQIISAEVIINGKLEVVWLTIPKRVIKAIQDSYKVTINATIDR